jgi:hypothetical protein
VTVVAAVVAGRLMLRVYDGDDLVLEVPVTRQRALLLARDLLDLAI